MLRKLHLFLLQCVIPAKAGIYSTHGSNRPNSRIDSRLRGNDTRICLLALFLTLTLTSCGFHLRGPTALAQPLKNIYLQSQDPYGDLSRNLKQYLIMSGVHIADSPQEATTTLNIIKEATNQDLLSINSSQQTRQYSLKLAVTFDILNSRGEPYITPQTVKETRPLTLQSNQILAGSNQAAELYHEMRRVIVYNIINKLASKDVTMALTQQDKS